MSPNDREGSSALGERMFMSTVQADVADVAEKVEA